MKVQTKKKVIFWSIIVVVGLFLLPWASKLTHATTSKPEPVPQQEQEQYQDQSQGQEQEQEQGQEQQMDQSMTGGTQTVSFVGQKQAFSANAPTVFSTAPCYVGKSGGIGVQGLNIGGGKATLDVQCELRETARMLISAGELELGVELLCLTDAASMLPEGRCHPHSDVEAALKAAQDRVAFLLNERAIDRVTCEESKDRIMEGCIK